MSILEYSGIEVAGISACVPREKVTNSNFDKNIFSEKDIENVRSIVGIEERRRVQSASTAGDLCLAAAENLIKTLEIDRSEIAAIIFVSQTPDYRQPATAPWIQYKLGLSDSTLAFDINLACSGFVYGMMVASSMLSNPEMGSILLLAGDTLTKTVSAKDRGTGLLFGDAGSACLLRRSRENRKISILLGTDGSRQDAIKVPYGGYRNPSCPESLVLQEREDGSIRSDEQLVLNGMEVFNFTTREVPKNIKQITDSVASIDAINYFVFHQANKHVTSFIGKKIGIDNSKLLYSIAKFGNTSSASIPLTICHNYNGLNSDLSKYLLCGFGAGLSWGSVITDIEKSAVLPIYQSDL